MRPIARLFLTIASVAALSTTSHALSDEEKAKREANRLKTAPFHIVLVVGSDGAKCLKEIEPHLIRGYQKELDTAYMQSVQLWRESRALFRKSAENKGKKFDEACPTRPVLKIMKSRVRGQDAAQAMLKALDEKWLQPLIEKEKAKADAKAAAEAKKDPRQSPEFRPKGNQVTNGGFENRKADSKLADRWTSGQWGAAGSKYSVRRTRSNPHEGKYSMVARSMSDGGKAGMQTDVKLPPCTYELRFWVCADPGKTAVVGASFGGKDLPQDTITEEWQQIKKAITVEKTAFRTKLQIWTATANVRVYFDEVEIEAAIEAAK